MFSISKLMALIYLVAMLSSIFKTVTPRDLFPYFSNILIFFLILTIVSIVHIQRGNYNFFDFTIFQNIALFWILVNHERKDPGILEKALLAFAAGSILLALLFHLGIGVGLDMEGRVSIFGDNENNIGLRMSISMIIVSMVVIQNHFRLGKIRFLFLLGIPLLFSLMLATGSRVSLISFVLAYIATNALLRTKRIWIKVAVFVVGTLVLLYIWFVLLDSQEVMLRLLRTVNEGDLSKRDVIWKRLLPLISDNLIFGVGKTGFESATYDIFGRVISPHNVILEVLCLTGVAGLFFYLMFIYRIFRRSIMLYRTEKFLLPVILCIPFLGMLLSAQLLHIKLGWVICAFIAGSAFSNHDNMIITQTHEYTAGD
jgi:O-antigen ligase